jgi:hypothetical protein
MNTERERVFSEMESKYGIDMKGKTPIGELPNIMTKVDWLLVSCFLKYPNGIPKDKSPSVDFAIEKIAIDAVDTGGNHLMMCNSSDLSDATVHSILNDVEIALKNREVKS